MKTDLEISNAWPSTVCRDGEAVADPPPTHHTRHPSDTQDRPGNPSSWRQNSVACASMPPYMPKPWHPEGLAPPKYLDDSGRHSCGREMFNGHSDQVHGHLEDRGQRLRSPCITISPPDPESGPPPQVSMPLVTPQPIPPPFPPIPPIAQGDPKPKPSNAVLRERARRQGQLERLLLLRERDLVDFSNCAHVCLVLLTVYALHAAITAVLLTFLDAVMSGDGTGVLERAGVHGKIVFVSFLFIPYLHPRLRKFVVGRCESADETLVNQIRHGEAFRREAKGWIGFREGMEDDWIDKVPNWYWAEWVINDRMRRKIRVQWAARLKRFLLAEVALFGMLCVMCLFLRALWAR